MALNPQVIGTSMPHGFAGCYARQPDMIVETRPGGGDDKIVFGTREVRCERQCGGICRNRYHRRAVCRCGAAAEISAL